MANGFGTIPSAVAQLAARQQVLGPNQDLMASLAQGFQQGQALVDLPQALQRQQQAQALQQLQQQLATATAQRQLQDLQDPQGALLRQLQQQLVLKSVDPTSGVISAPTNLGTETIGVPAALTPEQQTALVTGGAQPVVSPGIAVQPITVGGLPTGFSQDIGRAAAGTEAIYNARGQSALERQNLANAQAQASLLSQEQRAREANASREGIAARNADAKAAIGSPAEVDPTELKGALNYYKQSGNLPAFGMGKSGLRSAFYAALGGEEVNSISQGLENKAVRSGMQKAYATQQNQYQATNTAIKTLDKQLDLSKSLSSKVDRTGSPLINKYLLYLKGTVGGDADTKMFENSVNTAANEFAKILSGSAASIAGSTVSSAEDAKNLLNASLSNGTYDQVVDLMKKEGQFRISSQKDTIDQIRSDIGDIGNESKTVTSPVAPAPVSSTLPKVIRITPHAP